MRVAIYARVSTDRDEQKNSLENQLVYASDLITRNGWIVAGRYIDNGISGANIAKREEIKRLLEDAKKKKFDAIIAKSVSRLGRNTLENLQTASEIERLNIRLILPEDNYDTDNSTSKFMFNLKAILAEEESAKLSARIKIGRQAGARQGKYQAALPAFGYKKDDTKKLVLDEQYAPIVRKIFNLYLYEGWGGFRIANYLNVQGIPTPRSVTGGRNAGTMWHESSLRVILTNITYTGTLVQHREETVDFISKKRKKVEADRQIVVENSHPAIITMDEFHAVKEKMRRKGKNKSNGQESLFAHIAVCADCGKGMQFRKDRGKEGAYVCGGYVRHRKAFCTSHLISKNILMEAVKTDLKELIENNVRLERLYSVLTGEAQRNQSNLKKDLQRINKQLSKLTSDFQSLFHLYTSKAISLEQFSTQNEHLQEEQSRLSNHKAEIEATLDAKKDTEQHLVIFQKQIAKFASLNIEDEQVLKQVLQGVIHQIEVKEGGSIKIHYNITSPNSIILSDKRGA